MSNFINEITVMNYYIEQLDKDEITFLKNRNEKKAEIRDLVVALRDATAMNDKIQVATKLWKKLFDSAMSYISPDKRGYDKIFDFFDAYVEFEELIFASDSFYRDHTLHCIWVYFLGEYVAREPQFSPLFREKNSLPILLDSLKDLLVNDLSYEHLVQLIHGYLEKEESARCIAALTHDLGYPLKKIEKVNKSIKKVLPFFAVTSFDDFSFEYSNIQQEFISDFIDFLSRNFSTGLEFSDEKYETKENVQRINTLLDNVVISDSYGNAIAVNEEAKANLTSDDINTLTKITSWRNTYKLSQASKNQFLNDFENYQHGIMSAFLLVKNLSAFQNISYDAKKDLLLRTSSIEVITMHTILSSIANHTNDSFKIHAVDEDSFLTLIDELEEFSRISRASQNREYVKEFCESSIEMDEDNWLNITFLFNNAELDNLDPERAFKGRCKRFLNLFDIPKLSPSLKIRVTVIGDLPTDQNTYVLEIANKYADIRINNESVCIPKYLKSTQFFTKEEYASM